MTDGIDAPRPRVRVGRMGKMWRTVVAVVLFFRDAVMEDLARIWKHGRLFLGMVLTTLGVLSFASDRYCDGNTSAYYACTRPATYYYYPWWAILLILLGSCSIVLWFLRKKTR